MSFCICLARERKRERKKTQQHCYGYHNAPPPFSLLSWFPSWKVPMMYSATPATVSAATSPATSVPYAATAPANQVCSFLKLSVINPWALNKCFIFKSGELLQHLRSIALLALPLIKLHVSSRTRLHLTPHRTQRSSIWKYLCGIYCLLHGFWVVFFFFFVLHLLSASF